MKINSWALLLFLWPFLFFPEQPRPATSWDPSSSSPSPWPVPYRPPVRASGDAPPCRLFPKRARTPREPSSLSITSPSTTKPTTTAHPSFLIPYALLSLHATSAFLSPFLSSPPSKKRRRRKPHHRCTSSPVPRWLFTTSVRRALSQPM